MNAQLPMLPSRYSWAPFCHVLRHGQDVQRGIAMRDGAGDDGQKTSHLSPLIIHHGRKEWLRGNFVKESDLLVEIGYFEATQALRNKLSEWQKMNRKKV